MIDEISFRKSLSDVIFRNPLEREFQSLASLVKNDPAILEDTNLDNKRPVPLLDIDLLEFRFSKFLEFSHQKILGD